MGQLAFNTGIGRRLYDTAKKSNRREAQLN
jgi:hypothetical protein